jgi:4-hydroxy-3-methylbut-2-enyl diphosphate reductase
VKAAAVSGRRAALLVFDQRSRLWTGAGGGPELPQPAYLGVPSGQPEVFFEVFLRDRFGLAGAVHRLAACPLGEGECEVFAALLRNPPDGGHAFMSLDSVQRAAAAGRLHLRPELETILAGIEPALVHLPYLDLKENEYIYRFRTARERNRKVYIDGQSDALYQSALCAAIKEARRTKEKSSSDPAELDFGAVRYVIPSHFGFCLGVQNAIERAYETIAENPGSRVFMLSELIHNPFVNGDLLKRGLCYLQTDKGLPLRPDGSPASGRDDPEALWNQLREDDIVIIPAFGATNEDKVRLIRRGLSLREHDATCMLVEKVWKAARRYAEEGFTVIIHGKAEHEETKATFSNSAGHGPALIIRNLEHAQRLGEIILAPAGQRARLFDEAFSGLHSEGFDPERDLRRIAVVNQTTLLRNETLRIIDYFREVMALKYGEDSVADHLWTRGKGDTLCYATQVNQDALEKAVVREIDVAIVVGGKNSSNTYQLFRVCRARFGERAFYIQSEENILSASRIRHYIFPKDGVAPDGSSEEIRPFLPEAGRPVRVLLTGGASCPDGIIQQVIHRINGLFPAGSVRPMEETLEGFASTA